MDGTTAPARSLAQRMSALKTANRVRTRRGDTKGAMKSGLLTMPEMASLVIDPPDWMETMKVFDLLLAMPKMGRVKANKRLQQVRISPSKTVGGMSERQRRELVSLVWRG